MKRKTGRRRREGYVLVTAAAVAIVLVAFMGLVTDVGMMRYWKRRAQNAADAAAVGALMEITKNGTGSDYVGAGRSDAASLGLAHDVDGVSVTLAYPPQSGLYQAKDKYAEAVVTKRLPLAFLPILNRNVATVSARSVAGARIGDACIIALRKTGNSGFKAWGSSILHSACGIWVNANGSQAFEVGNGAETIASSINVVGGSDIAGTVQPAPITGMPVMDDPFLDKQPPASAGGPCNHVNFNANNFTLIFPGVYCGGITASGGTIYMWPGTYILRGGGMKIVGNATIIGPGVTIYNTYGAGYQYGPIQLNGTSTILLSAPSGGDMEGILFFTDRTAPYNQNQPNKLLGDNTSKFEGVIYMPSVGLEFTGSSAVAMYTVVVAYEINLTGNSEVHNDYSGLDSGSPIKTKGAITVE